MDQNPFCFLWLSTLLISSSCHRSLSPPTPSPLPTSHGAPLPLPCVAMEYGLVSSCVWLCHTHPSVLSKMWPLRNRSLFSKQGLQACIHCEVRGVERLRLSEELQAERAAHSDLQGQAHRHAWREGTQRNRILVWLQVLIIRDFPFQKTICGGGDKSVHRVLAWQTGFYPKNHTNWVWWHMPRIPAPGRWKQEDQKFSFSRIFIHEDLNHILFKAFLLSPSIIILVSAHAPTAHSSILLLFMCFHIQKDKTWKCTRFSLLLCRGDVCSFTQGEILKSPQGKKKMDAAANEWTMIQSMFFPKCLHFVTVVTRISASGHFR